MIPAPPIPPPALAVQPAPHYQPPPTQYQPSQYQPPRYRPPHAPYPGTQPPPVVLYEQYDFGGANTAISARVDNLDITQWNDRAMSMLINEGNWELCTDAFFHGRCNVFGPGSYRDLGNGLVGQVSSLRRVDNGRSARDAGIYPPPPPPAYPPPTAYAPPSANAPSSAYAPPVPAYVPPAPAAYPPRIPRAILFSERDFRGRQVVIDGDLPDLDGTEFNDRAVSLRVEAGFWQFCTDAGYAGDCRAFGPGDYPDLPDGFEGRISSVRRVAAPDR
ncbi:MAG: beta/gamma crystallin-related protein [Casimicrobiaceae bacterium]